MRNTIISTLTAVVLAAATPAPAAAQLTYTGGSFANHGTHGPEIPHLHTSSQWKECSFRLDPSLTREAWRQFTREAGMVVYFRPLADARSMGRGKFELSILQWKTGIDDADAAWNDTFVHPDAEHWLFEGSGLAFPGLSARAGITNSTDVGAYYSRNPNANYGVWAAQLQQNVVRGDAGNLSVRGSYSALFGPGDVSLNVIGTDVVASRTVRVGRWATLSPYAGVSAYVTRSYEKSAVVSLANESAAGLQAMGGAVLQLPGVRLAAEYNAAEVNSLSFRIGFGR